VAAISTAERSNLSWWRSSTYAIDPCGKKNHDQWIHARKVSCESTSPSRPSARCSRTLGTSPKPIARSIAIG